MYGEIDGAARVWPPTAVLGPHVFVEWTFPCAARAALLLAHPGRSRNAVAGHAGVKARTRTPTPGNGVGYRTMSLSAQFFGVKL